MEHVEFHRVKISWMSLCSVTFCCFCFAVRAAVALALFLKCPTRRLPAAMGRQIGSCFRAALMHNCKVCTAQQTPWILPQDGLSYSSLAHNTILAASSCMTATLFSAGISNSSSTSQSRSAMLAAVWLTSITFVSNMNECSRQSSEIKCAVTVM